LSLYAPKKPKKINAVSVTLTLLLGTLGYLGWWYLPHWFVAWQMSNAALNVGRKGYRETDDNKLLDALLKEAQRIGMKGVSKENFSIWREPYPDYDPELQGKRPEAIEVFQKRGKFIHVSYAWTVNAQWPLLDDSTPLTFEKERIVDLATIKW
jgi:hypothetical protein